MFGTIPAHKFNPLILFLISNNKVVLMSTRLNFVSAVDLAAKSSSHSHFSSIHACRVYNCSAKVSNYYLSNSFLCFFGVEELT